MAFSQVRFGCRSALTRGPLRRDNGPLVHELPDAGEVLGAELPAAAAVERSEHLQLRVRAAASENEAPDLPSNTHIQLYPRYETPSVLDCSSTRKARKNPRLDSAGGEEENEAQTDNCNCCRP